MEQFNYVKDHRGLDDPAGYTFIRAITEFMGEDDRNEVFAHAHANEGNVDIELTINGIPVSFVKVVESIWASFKDMSDKDIKNAAIDLIQRSRLANLFQTLEHAERQIADELDKLEFNRD